MQNMTRLSFYFLLLVFSSGCAAEDSQAEYDAMVITTVSGSEELSQYKAARGIRNIPEISFVSAKVITSDIIGSFYTELGLNYIVVYTYKWADEACVIGMPVKADKGHVISIGDGFSDGSCGE